jgi:DNA-binding NarL/FixJ family response regulator
MEPTTTVAIPPPAAAAELAKTIRVLIVDDEPLFVELVEVMLGAEEGIEIAGVAADGEEGVRLAAELAPDIIVMDINMPVMNGIEATRQICANDPDARILILTGGAPVKEIDEARAAGAAVYLTKDRIARDFVTELRELADR